MTNYMTSLKFSKVVPRRSIVVSTSRNIIKGNAEQCCPQIFSNSGDPRGINQNVLQLKQVYPGDRFIPRRCGYNFEMANYLLKQSDNAEIRKEIDFCAEVDSLEKRYRREAMHTMMLNLGVISGLKQNKILRCPVSDNSATQFPKTEGRGKWKCIPRKKRLIGNVDKMLSIPDSSDNVTNRSVDWSCKDMISAGDQKGLTIYGSNGEQVVMWHETECPSVIKWSNDGNKIACTLPTEAILKLYDLKEKKLLWNVFCFCGTEVHWDNCDNHCICWSKDDRYIITGCNGAIAVYEANSGWLRSNIYAHNDRILTLSFSANFKYIVSTALDNIVQVFTWPNMDSHCSLEFAKPVKAVAWHPETNQLCIGGARDMTLSLWNVNTCEMISYVPTKHDGCVQNLVWNKLSGELVVHWSYTEGDKRYNVVPILASLERIVDVLPLHKEAQLSFLKFNDTQEELVTYCNDVFSIWNFFGNQGPPKKRCIPFYSTRRREQIITFNPIR